MTADPIPKAASEPLSVPKGVRPTARQLFRELDGPVDERFKQSLAGLSRQLGARVPRQQSKDDLQAAAEVRRAALEAYDLARTGRLKLALATVGGMVVAAGVAWFVLDVLSVSSPPRMTASTERVPPVAVATAAPSSPLASPAPPASEPSPPGPIPMVAQSIVPAAVGEKTSVELAPVETSREPAPLQRDEVKEVQSRLRSFGFNPGPLDGAAGPMTQAAVARYRQDRGQQQPGTVDRDLLEQLRQDPAPPVVAAPVAQRAARPSPSRPTNSSNARSSDPFEPFRAAANRFDQWMQGR